MQLVIAEKPSVARNIAKVLHATNVKDGYLEGKEYLVSWCIGHLIELASADQYRYDWKAWKYETLPMIPENWKYQIKESTKGQFRVLKELLHRADITEVICATDAGREGELIFRLVYNQAECKLPFKRLWISSMEEKAILEGFQQLKDGHEYDDLYYSAVARSEADWLVGINATRLFTVLYHHRLIVGRVQTPTLAMLVEREKSIENFQKEKYYLVHLLMDGLDAVSNRIKEKSAAVQMMEDMKDETAQILSVKKEKKKVQPPKLYDLTTLQREANRLLGFTAQQTLDYTQSLYEKKLVTYPRTDSQYLTDDMEENALLVVGAVNSMFPEMSIKGSEPDIKRLLNSKKVSDHHAIIPTVEITNMDLKALPGGEKEILMLIASKLLCASEQEYIYESIKTEISCHGELFTASGKNVLQYGWKEVEERFFKSYGKNAENPEEEESDFPDIKMGQVFESVVVKFSEHFTAPPKHYTEDTLLSAMEHAGSSEMTEDAERKGLGTPATRAAIIEKLVEKGFIERKKKQILPTTDGRNLIRILPEMIKSPKLTAEWENDLTLIAKGQKNAEEFLYGIEKMVTKLVSDNGEPVEEYQKLFSDDRKEIGKCPRCGNKVYVGNRNYYCSGSDCNFTLWKNNRFFESQGKTLDEATVRKLLSEKQVHFKDLVSEKTKRKYEATLTKTQDTVYLKEITAPEGYVVQASSYGVKLVVGSTTKQTVTDKEQKGNLTVYKEGEVFVGAVSDENGTLFQYEKRRQKGAVYNVYAAEDIVTAGGKTVYKKGAEVAKNLITGENGSVTVKNLPLGSYNVTEAQAPENFYNAKETKKVTISYAGQTAEAAFSETTFTNDRQKAVVQVIKKDKDTENTLSGGHFALFAAQDMKTVDGKVAVKKDALIETAITGTDGKAAFKADLPVGFSYYVKEVQAPAGYVRNEKDTYSFQFSYTNDEQAKISFSHIFVNDRVSAAISLNMLAYIRMIWLYLILCLIL